MTELLNLPELPDLLNLPEPIDQLDPLELPDPQDLPDHPPSLTQRRTCVQRSRDNTKDPENPWPPRPGVFWRALGDLLTCLGDRGSADVPRGSRFC
ncbi:hypothetical protein ACIPN8_39380 [Streptomyces sp. NPDC086082]|uniref:hypothetical protein n=1 Tax=Streptomyces sp. NPDC086082 TaxID=3365750 RepID=UPI003821A4E0